VAPRWPNAELKFYHFIQNDRMITNTQMVAQGMEKLTFSAIVIAVVTVTKNADSN
jgi:hypothetical protein